MAQSKSSRRWLQEHFSDPYVKQAVKAGFRSRASYKLLAMQQKLQLIRAGMVVVDLGASPGGWSQVVSQILAGRGVLIASDLLPMDPLPEVQFILGDFSEEATLESIMQALDNRLVDLVISDIAPNMSGIRTADQFASIGLCELVVDFATKVLKPEADLLMKIFQGEGFDVLYREVKQLFGRVQMIKPEASRGRSREQYLYASGFKSRSGCEG